MALQGTLDTFALADVLRLLAATRKSGRLEITGSHGAGSIWVAGGDVTAVLVDHAPLAVDLVEATFELLRFDRGSFTFDAEAAPNGDQASDVEPLLDGAEALLAEWRVIEAVVPSLRSWVTMRQELPDETVTIDRVAWTTLAAVGSGSTVTTIGEALGLSELRVSRAVRDLVELGIVDIAERAPEPIIESADHPEAMITPSDPDADRAAGSTGEPVDEAVDAEASVEPAAAEVDVDEAAASGSIPGPKARRARPKQLRVSDSSQTDVFVPLDLSALQQQRSYDSDEVPVAEAQGAADPVHEAPVAAEPSADPQVAEPQVTEAPSDEAPVGEPPAGEHDPDGDEPLNRGLLLKFLSSVKS